MGGFLAGDDLHPRRPGRQVQQVAQLGHVRTLPDNRYRRDAAYGRSKLANLLFTYELQRRLTATGSRTITVANHPGQSRTDFTRDMNPVARFVYGPRMRHLTGLVMQDRTVGVLSEVRAVVDPEVPAGSYYAP